MSGGGGADLFFIFQLSTYFKEGRPDLHREAIDPTGPIASRGGPVAVF